MELEALARQVREIITHEVQTGATVGMYESKHRVIFTLEANGEIYVIAEVKRPNEWSPGVTRMPV